MECLPPSPPLFELLALSQVTKQDSITGRWNPKWPCLPPYVCSCECVSVRLSPVPVIYPIYLIFVLRVVACLLHPSQHTLSSRLLPITSHHTQTPICMVCVSGSVAMPTAHFPCCSCERVWSEPTLPPTGYSGKLQALKQQFPYQNPPKELRQKMHWLQNVVVPFVISYVLFYNSIHGICDYSILFSSINSAALSALYIQLGGSAGAEDHLRCCRALALTWDCTEALNEAWRRMNNWSCSLPHW